MKKRLLAVGFLVLLLFAVAIMPILAAQLYTFDTDAQGWEPTDRFVSYIGHEAPGSMKVEPHPPAPPERVSFSKAVTLTNGDLSFWAYQGGPGAIPDAIVSIDSTPICTFSLSSSWQNYTCTITSPGFHSLALAGEGFGEICHTAPTCYVFFDEISVPEAEEEEPPPAYPFRLYLPALYRAAIP
jgi:hypothetical protein